jgi:hypothetical protein
MSAGEGRTLNASSRGLLIACDGHALAPGSWVRLSLEWPSKLDGKTPLQLIAVGRVTRCQSTDFAVRLEGYQFRTRKR